MRNILAAFGFIIFLCIAVMSVSSNRAPTVSPNTNIVNEASVKSAVDLEETPVKPVEVKKTPTCIQDELISKSCTACNIATEERYNLDCTKYTKEVSDTSCTDLCPKPEPVYVAPAYTPPAEPSFSCNCNKTCTQMISCQEAYYQLNTCGCNKRDGDNDGVPCEDIC